MSYSISISGHGADKALVEHVTRDAVRQLREPENATAGATAGGYGPDGQSFTISISSTDVLEDDPRASETEVPES